MIVNQQAVQNLYVGFKTIFNKTLQNVEPSYKQLATVVTSNTKSEQYKWIGKMPRIREWIGERQIQNLSASDYEIKNKKFEGTIGVDRDDIEDDNLGIYPPLIQELGQSAATFPDDLVFDLLLNGFTNKCYDGKPFFDEKHKVGKIELSNKSTKKLSVDSYGAARAAMMSLKDENGKSLKINPNLLVVPPQLEGEGRKILLSEQIEGSTNLYKDSAKLLVAPELSGNPTAWFLMDTTRPLRPLIFQTRKKPNLVSLTNEKDTNVFFNNQFIYGVDFRCNAGYGLWQLGYGSTGETA